MPDEDRLPRPVLEVLNRLRSSHASERRRIARQLHDQIAHTLVIALNSLELHEWQLPEGPVSERGQLQAAMQAIRQALDSVRGLSAELRSRAVPEGLESALCDYLRTVAPPSVRWTVSMSGYEAGLPEDVCVELYLILREAAHNALIHSSARNLRIAVVAATDSVLATVHDDGGGFDVDRHGATGGLAGMRERAKLRGGSVAVTSAPGAGTLITVEIPLAPAVDE